MVFWITLAGAVVAFGHAFVDLGKLIAAKTKNKTDDKVIAYIGKGVDEVDSIIHKIK